MLLHEALKYLNPVPDGCYVDGTVGDAGHSLAIGKMLSERGRLVCLDRDPHAVAIAEKRLAFLKDRVDVLKKNYADIDKVMAHLGVDALNGVLLDLGMSSDQIETSGRGFSFLKNEPLDMRMDPDDEVTAHHLVNRLPLKELEKILREYGEERQAKKITRGIIKERVKRPIDKSAQLADIVKAIVPSTTRFRAKHPATQTFQALRIAVNRELQNIEIFLDKIPALMAKGGRLVILSYHSLEDRRIKQAITRWENPCTCPKGFPRCVCGKTPLFRRVLKKGIKPSQQEIAQNPRARSAILRVAERI